MYIIMKKSSLLPALALLAVAEGVCHNYEEDYYKEIGCKVLAKNDQGCPTSYDCNMLKQRSQDKCHYQGNTFDAGHKLQSSPTAPCVVECRCLMGEDKRALFNCVDIECPEYFNGPPEPNCYRTYEHGKCCYIDDICVDPAEQKARKEVCEHGGQSYQLGQRFYPDNTCLECICQSRYNGSLVEPFCKRIPCYMELQVGDRIADGCVPVYYGEKGCCPIDWRCPEASDAVLPGDKRTVPSTNLGSSCQFGNMTMKIGERLNPSEEVGEDTTCTCRVPPHPICIQKENSH